MKRTGVWLAYGALAAFFCAAMWQTPLGLGISDWDYHLLHYGIVLRSLFSYGQPPFWNPWLCGGNVLWQNPQVALVSPVYILGPLLSLPIAFKVTVLAHYLVGLAGMHLLLTRSIGLRYFPAVMYIASIFAFASGITLHLAVGHATFLPYFYMPLQLFLFLRAVETGDLRYVLGVATLFALAIYGGGIYIIAMSGAGFAVFAVALALLSRTWRPVIMGALVVLVSALFAAPKLVPTAMLLADPRFLDARNPAAPTPLSVALLAHVFLDPFTTLRTRLPGQAYDWHEYGNHIGSLAAILIAASFIAIVSQHPWRREHALGSALAATAVLLMLLLLGEVHPFAPAELLRQLPVFSGLRPSTRFALPFSLFGAGMVGWAAARALGPPGPSFAPRLLAPVCVLATLLLVITNRVPLEAGFSAASVPGDLTFFRNTGTPQIDDRVNPYTPNTPMLRAFVANRRIWSCYEPLQLVRVANDDEPLVYGTPGTRLHRVQFAPNGIRFGVTVEQESGRVYLNQNYVRGWSSDAGPVQIDPVSGQAYVNISRARPGTYRFWFVPPGLMMGLALGACGVAVGLLLWNRRLP